MAKLPVMAFLINCPCLACLMQIQLCSWSCSHLEGQRGKVFHVHDCNAERCFLRWPEQVCRALVWMGKGAFLGSLFGTSFCKERWLCIRPAQRLGRRCSNGRWESFGPIIHIIHLAARKHNSSCNFSLFSFFSFANGTEINHFTGSLCLHHQDSSGGSSEINFPSVHTCT